MKHLILTIALTLTTTFSFAQNEKGQDITVSINQFSNNKGHVIIALHTKKTFMKADGIVSEEVKIKDGKVEVTFKNITPGEYLVMALHDQNDNKRMDFQNNGMPLESYGISNNPMLMGPPTFSAGKFEVKNENININIRF